MELVDFKINKDGASWLFNLRVKSTIVDFKMYNHKVVIDVINNILFNRCS